MARVNEHEELIMVREKLRELIAECRSYKSWHTEFYNRIEAKYPDIVAEIEEEMGTDDEKEKDNDHLLRSAIGHTLSL